MDTEGNRMSSTRDMEADRLARVKLSCVTEPGDLRVMGLVSEAGAGKILGYLAAATEVESHWNALKFAWLAVLAPMMSLRLMLGRRAAAVS